MEQKKIEDYLKKVKELDDRINQIEDDNNKESFEKMFEEITEITEKISDLESDITKPKINVDTITNEIFEHLFGEFRLNYPTDVDKKGVIKLLLQKNIK